MRRVILAVLVAGIVLGFAWYIAGLPGHVDISIAGYSVSTAAPVAVLALLLFVAIVYLIVRAIAWALLTPLRMGSWAARRRRRSGDVSIGRALEAIAAGDAEAAESETGRSRRALGDTPQTLLLSAEAARLAGDEGRATELFKQMAARPDSAFLGLRGLFRQAMAREDWDEAAALARRAEVVRPGGTWLRDERTMLAVRTGNWTQALMLAGPDAPIADYATAAAESETNPDEALRLAKRTSRDNPAFVPAAIAYARRLRGANKEARAQAVLRNAWVANPNPEIADYLLAPISDKLARVREGAKLEAANPSSPESHFLMARLQLDAGLTREARRQIEEARRLGLTQRRLWLLMAELEETEQGDSVAGRAAVAAALRNAATAPPDSVWSCQTCGTVHSMWMAACPACHTPGRIRWGSPTRLLSLPEPSAQIAAPVTI